MGVDEDSWRTGKTPNCSRFIVLLKCVVHSWAGRQRTQSPPSLPLSSPVRSQIVAGVLITEETDFLSGPGSCQYSVLSDVPHGIRKARFGEVLIFIGHDLTQAASLYVSPCPPFKNNRFKMINDARSHRLRFLR